MQNVFNVLNGAPDELIPQGGFKVPDGVKKNVGKSH